MTPLVMSGRIVRHIGGRWDSYARALWLARQWRLNGRRKWSLNYLDIAATDRMRGAQNAD